MNKISFLIVLLLAAFIVPTHAQVKLKGNIKTPDHVQMVFLSYRTADATVRDSVKPVDGKFQFAANITEPMLANLSLRFDPKADAKPRMDGMQVFLEPGEIKLEVKDTLKFAKITGSKSHKEFEAFNELQKPYNEKGRDLSSQYRKFSEAKDEAGMKKIRDEYDVLNEEKNEKLFRKYLLEKPASPIALYVLKQYAGFDIDVQKVEPLFASLPAAVRTSTSGKAFSQSLEIAKKTMVGAPAMDFTQNDTSGIPVSLASFKGKYVLIDFWASWCGPCRAENPNVVKAFQAFKDKNFTVLGISLDQPGKQKAWLDAIYKDNLTWTHVSDLNYFDNAVAKQYGIMAIPQNFLVDKEGKIIAKNIRGEELSKKLGELIN